jgi:hypothetical protein
MVHFLQVLDEGPSVERSICHRGGRYDTGYRVLELPRSEGDVQEELNIEREASYVISVKNPEKPAPRSAGLSSKQEANYSRPMQEKF